MFAYALFCDMNTFFWRLGYTHKVKIWEKSLKKLWPPIKIENKTRMFQKGQILL